MSTQPKCLYSGLLVGNRFSIPEDTKRYYNDEQKTVGCNQLFCTDCKNYLRNWAGFRFNPEKMKKGKNKFAGTGVVMEGENVPKKIYETSDPDKQIYFTKKLSGDLYRIYACKCSYFETPSIYMLSAGDWIETDSWQCAGHPQK